MLLLGWLTGLRGVMHGLLISIGATALLPFALLLALVAVVAAVSLASALLVTDDSSLPSPNASAAHGRWQQAYYLQLARQRQSPLAWGFVAGGALGIVGVWLVLAALVVPLETRTVGILRLAQARLASSLPSAESPAPSDDILRASAWSPAASAGADEPVLDGFGHPLTRAVRAREFTLRSLGLDGVASRDDLCASGQAGSSPAAAGDGLRFVEDLRADRLGWPALFAAIDAARCTTR